MKRKSVTDKTRRRYDRLAPYYDLFEAPVENRRFSHWRLRLREKIRGATALEIGVGTGKNMKYYPPGVTMTAVDLSPRMLKKGRLRAKTLKVEVDLREMDVQDLHFPDNTFDTVFATFVFCSVPDPILGLKEMHRVCKPDGKLLLLEHMRPGNRFLAAIFDSVNPIVVRMMGANINRRTMESIRQAGWNVVVEEKISFDIVKWVEARPHPYA